MTRALFEKMAQMDIHAYSCRCIGTNHVDLEAAKSLGIKVANARYSPCGVADYTVMLMLMLLRRYKPALWRQQVNDYSLGGLMGRELRGMTVGVIGTGRIGLTVMQNLSGFGCKLLCNDLYKNPEAEKFGTYTDLDTIYRACDIITLHTPLLDSTWHMINERKDEKGRPSDQLRARRTDGYRSRDPCNRERRDRRRCP